MSGVRNYIRRGSFLDFVEAREYVRQQGLKSNAEWQDYATHKRPSFIPRHPAVVYRNDGFIDYSDFVGYEKRKIKISFRSPSEPKELAVPEGHFSAQNVVFLHETLSKNDPDFEHRYLPKRMGVHVAIRHRLLSPPDKWLFVRVSTEHGSTSRQFSHSKAVGELVLCFLSKNADKIYVTHSESFGMSPKRGLVFLKDSLLTESSPRSIADHFRELCADSRKSRDFWTGLLGLHNECPLQRNTKSLYDLQISLYAPAGLSMRFPCPENATDVIINSYIRDRRCIHRTASRLRGVGVYFVPLSHRSSNDDVTYFTRADDFDDMVISIYDGSDLKGIFIFSKDEIMTMIENGREGYTSGLSLYSPSCIPKRRHSKARQERQLQNYIDLFTPEAREMAVKRIQERMCSTQDAETVLVEDDSKSKIDVALKI